MNINRINEQHTGFPMFAMVTATALRFTYGMSMRALTARIGPSASHRDLWLGPSRLGKKTSMLEKMARRTRNKFLFDVKFPLEVVPRARGLIGHGCCPSDHELPRRLRILNAILLQSVSDLLTTPEVSQELYDLQLNIDAVRLSADFSVCHLYWHGQGNQDEDAHIESVLQLNSGRLRYLLQTYHVMGKIPPLVFLKDKKYAATTEVEHWLSIIKTELDNVETPEISSEVMDQKDRMWSEKEGKWISMPSLTDHRDRRAPSWLGIDRQALLQQIADTKRKGEWGIAPDQPVRRRRSGRLERKQAKQQRIEDEHVVWLAKGHREEEEEGEETAINEWKDLENDGKDDGENDSDVHERAPWER
uniref:Ribosome-binding factor A, mitochondrial n=1 Tax=Eptatretus burgeri TaxID=7764 RepID=A0A8C4QKL8_EPTBU